MQKPHEFEIVKPDWYEDQSGLLAGGQSIWNAVYVPR